MKIAHIGSSMARSGGPPGVLLQLQAAFGGGQLGDHAVCFPPSATTTGAALKSRSSLQRLRGLKRRLCGPPQYYRPAKADLEKIGGHIRHQLEYERAKTAPQLRYWWESFDIASCDVLFTFDVFAAEVMLQKRQLGQQVWLMNLNPMAMALYYAWNYGVPEWSWEEIAALPDVRAGIAQELQVWDAVDLLVHPSLEAHEEITRVDARFGQFTDKTEICAYSGSASRVDTRLDTSEIRRKLGLPLAEPVGLFLGNALPYRGLDALMAALDYLPRRSELPGVIAIAGPPDEGQFHHPRILQLGHVSKVGELVHAVDFVVNVNRFCLYDLSSLEAAEAGKPMLLHDIGGNKTLRKLGAGCLTFSSLDPQTVAGGLRRMFALAPERRSELGAASRHCYEQHLPLAKVRDDFLALYNRRAVRRPVPQERTRAIHVA